VTDVVGFVALAIVVIVTPRPTPAACPTRERGGRGARGRGTV